MKKRFLRAIFLTALLLLAFTAGDFAKIEVLADSPDKPLAVNYMFTSIDDQMISTNSTDGKSTVIVFGRTSCSNTQRTIKDFAEKNLAGSAGVRVIFAECDHASLNDTKNFAALYGNNTITFCYDVGYSISNAWNDYINTFNADISSLPTTVLIDKDNRIQKILSGTQSTNSIKTQLDSFANTGSGSEGSGNETPGGSEDTDPSQIVSVQINGTENYDYARQVLDLVNAERAKTGLSALQPDEALMETAMQRAAELSMYYSHTRPDGTKCSTASSRKAQMTAENIAIGQTSPQAVMNSWVNSKGHYDNIVNKDLTSIGIGCFKDNAGTLSWVQFFDNAQASVPSLSGSKEATRTVSILTSNLQLQPVKESTFSICTDKGKETAMEILHKNKEWSYTMPELSVSSFNFTSSNPAVAEVNTSGVITVQGAGSATVTASLKSGKDCQVTKTVTVSDHKYVSSIVAPTATAEGYTLHTCSGCGDSYKDSYVPKLEDTTTPDGSQNPDDSQNPDNPQNPDDSSKPDASQKPANSGTKPSNVSGAKTSSGSTSIKLNWNKTANADGYYIYEYQSSKKKWKKLAKVTSARNSYTVKKLKSGTNYRFAIKAYSKENGKEVLSDSYTSVYTATDPSPVKLKVTTGKQKAVLKWNKVKGATSYKIYYKTGTKGSWKKLKTTKTLHFTKKNLKSGKTYTFAVRACKDYKGKTYTSSLKKKQAKIK